MDNQFILRFNTDIGEKLSITIPRAAANLTDEQVRDAMQALIDNGTILTKAGTPISIISAVLLTKSERDLLAA